ncbi:hypothetical protein [Blastopirellula marina]
MASAAMSDSVEFFDGESEARAAINGPAPSATEL